MGELARPNHCPWIVEVSRDVYASFRSMNAEFRTNALWWADFVMYSTFFVMQKYLTDVWKMSFTTAGTFLNIWDGIYRIFPILFLFLADTILGNFVTLALSSIFSAMGLVLITVITGLGYRCDKEGEAECIGYTEKALFITAMALIAFGRAARFACAEPFIYYQDWIRYLPYQTKDKDQMTKHEEDQTNNRDQTTKHEEDQTNQDDDQIKNNEDDNIEDEATAQNGDDETNNKDQTVEHDDDEATAKPGKNPDPRSWLSRKSDDVGAGSVTLFVICFIVFCSMPTAAYLAFPHVKKWYLLFGVSAICTAFAAVIFLTGFRQYRNPLARLGHSPITDFLRVLVAAAFNISKPSPGLHDPCLHVTDNEEFQELSASPFLGFLHKAAIKPDSASTAEEAGARAGGKKGSWRLCSVSEVESAKVVIRMVLVYTTYLMGGVVYSIGNTYVVEQALNMNYNIGHWEPPLQLIQLLFMVGKVFAKAWRAGLAKNKNYAETDAAFTTTLMSIVCCTVSAAVERRRVHAVRRPDLVSLPDDAKVHMGAYWLLFQVLFLGFVEAYLRYDLSKFQKDEMPNSMERYRETFAEGVLGVGFMCGALSVYVVGKISETGSSKNWFQHTLNKSRLDRYYWVLAVLATLNLGLCFAVSSWYTRKSTYVPKPKDEKKKKKKTRTKRRKRTRKRHSWTNILMS